MFALDEATIYAIFQYKLRHYCLGDPMHYQKNEAKVCILAAGICRMSHMKDPLGTFWRQ